MRELPASYQDHQLRMFGTYQIQDRWTLVASATPVGILTFGASELEYIGGAEVGFRWAALPQPFELSLSLSAGARPGSGRINVDQGESLSEPRTLLEPIVGSAIGAASILARYGFGWGWLLVSGGGKIFSNARLDPALEAFAQLGFAPSESFFIDIRSSGRYAFGSLVPVNILGASQTRYVGLGLGLEWWTFPQFGLTAGADIGPFAESNAAALSFSLGAVFRR